MWIVNVETGRNRGVVRVARRCCNTSCSPQGRGDVARMLGGTCGGASVSVVGGGGRGAARGGKRGGAVEGEGEGVRKDGMLSSILRLAHLS